MIETRGDSPAPQLIPPLVGWLPIIFMQAHAPFLSLYLDNGSGGIQELGVRGYLLLAYPCLIRVQAAGCGVGGRGARQLHDSWHVPFKPTHTRTQVLTQICARCSSTVVADRQWSSSTPPPPVALCLLRFASAHGAPSASSARIPAQEVHTGWDLCLWNNRTCVGLRPAGWLVTFHMAEGIGHLNHLLLLIGEIRIFRALFRLQKTWFAKNVPFQREDLTIGTYNLTTEYHL